MSSALTDSGPADVLPGPQPEQTVGPRPAPRSGSSAWTITILLGLVILVPSLLGFVMKFGELVALTQDTATGGAEGGFAMTPVVNYLLASAGFFFLLLWAAVNGMFRDLEQAKHLMLQHEEELDRHV